MKKKILIVVPSLRFWWWSEKFCSILGNELIKRWYSVNYFTFYDAKLKYHLEWDEFSLNEKKTNYFWNILKLFNRAMKIKYFCLKNNIDVVISFVSDASFSALLSKIIGNRSKIYVSVQHSINAYKWIYYFLIKLLYKFADRIHVLTEFEKDNLIKNFHIDWKKIFFIPNFVDLNLCKKLSKEDLWEFRYLFSWEKFAFITVWRLEKIKNQKLMIEAFKKFNEKYPNVQLIILGDGKERNNLINISNQNIHFLWNQENVFKFLVNSKCFLLTSKSESFSIAILEAMACGLPIISTKTQWPCEILWNWSYWTLVDESADSLYSSMELIYLDEDMRRNLSLMSCKTAKLYQRNKYLKMRVDVLR